MTESISVILPTHNRPESLKRTVRSVLSQSLLPDELIIVNDGDDEIPADIADKVRQAGVQFIYRRRDYPSLPASRNVGIDASSGGILLLMDDDVELEREFLAEMSGMFEADKAGQVDGIGAVGTDFSVIPTAKNRLWGVLMFLTGHLRWMPRRCQANTRRLPTALRGLLKPAKFLIGGRVGVRRRVVEDVRFNEAFAGYALFEDRDFCYRATQRYAMFVAPSLKLTHHFDKNARPNAFTYGRMLVANQIHIVSEVLEPGVGKWMLLTWNMAGLVLVHTVYIPFGNHKFHFGVVRGLISGIVHAVAERITGPSCES